jgi:hypothetical protein
MGWINLLKTTGCLRFDHNDRPPDPAVKAFTPARMVPREHSFSWMSSK